MLMRLSAYLVSSGIIKVGSSAPDAGLQQMTTKIHHRFTIVCVVYSAFVMAVRSVYQSYLNNCR